MEGLTGEGVLLGTPDYMSPEQARDPRTADIRSDIYSLGCALYHALAGRPPFPDTNIISQMIRHATEPPRPLKEFSPAVPEGLQQIVNWMLAKDPNGRYPTPDRAAQALQVFLAAGAEPLHAPESDPKMRSYLSWLQTEDGTDPAPAASGPTRPRAQHPAAAPVRPAAPPGARRPSRRNCPSRPGRPARPTRTATPSAKRQKKHRPTAVPPPLSPVAAPPVVNVELVPMPPPAEPAPQKLFGPPFSRRDFLAFGIGAGAGAAVTFLGLLIALFGRKSTPPAAPPPPPEEKEKDKDKPGEG